MPCELLANNVNVSFMIDRFCTISFKSCKVSFLVNNYLNKWTVKKIKVYFAWVLPCLGYADSEVISFWQGNWPTFCGSNPINRKNDSKSKIFTEVKVGN